MSLRFLGDAAEFHIDGLLELAIANRSKYERAAVLEACSKANPITIIEAKLPDGFDTRFVEGHESGESAPGDFEVRATVKDCDLFDIQLDILTIWKSEIQLTDAPDPGT